MLRCQTMSDISLKEGDKKTHNPKISSALASLVEGGGKTAGFDGGSNSSVDMHLRCEDELTLTGHELAYAMN